MSKYEPSVEATDYTEIKMDKVWKNFPNINDDQANVLWQLVERAFDAGRKSALVQVDDLNRRYGKALKGLK